jgi:prepilin-type N-terminal cleavage/methylation domain-containing protein
MSVLCSRVPRRGVTLIELMVALALVALVTTLAHLLLTVMDRAEARLQLLVQQHADEATAAYAWRDLVLHATTSPLADRQPRFFVGTSNGVQFTSWCRGSRGFRVSCTVSARPQEATTRVGLLVSAGGSAWLVVTEGPVSLRYLEGSSGDLRWISDWQESRILPGGVALVGVRDTIVTRIGTSG